MPGLQVFLSLLLVLAVHEPDQIIEMQRAFAILNPAGQVLLSVDERTALLEGGRDSSLEATYQTATDAFVLKKSHDSPSPGGCRVRLTLTWLTGNATIDYCSGPAETTGRRPGERAMEVFKHETLQFGLERIEFSELQEADLLADKSASSQVERFRNAVPQSLRDFCGVFVQAADLIDADPIALHVTRLVAPQGTARDAARQGWHVGPVTLQRTVVVAAIPVSKSPPSIQRPLEDPEPVEPLIREIRSIVQKPVAVRFEVRADGTVGGCEVIRAVLTNSQRARLCGAVEKRRYPAGHPAEIEVTAAIQNASVTKMR